MNCGAPLQGSFCAQCGQEVKPLDPPVRHFIGEFAQELFDVDGRLLRSLRRLFFSPGFLTAEHADGRRKPWLSPLKLYLLTSVACFATLAIVGDHGGVQLTSTGDVDATIGEELGFASFDELKAAVDRARAEWIPRVMFVLVPFVAWVVALARRTSRRHYPAHLVFALHVFAAVFGVRALAAALGGLVPAAKAAFTAAVGLYLVGYLYLAFRRAYRLGRAVAIRDTVIVTFVTWAALLVGTGVVVGLAITRPWIRAKTGL
jgi:hypothetical protein